MQLQNLFANRKLDLSEWRKVKDKACVVHYGEKLPYVRGVGYQRKGSTRLSVGVLYFKGDLAFFAWGYKDEPHCRYHALVLPSGRISKPITGCPRIRVVRKKGKAEGFALSAFGREYTWI